MFRAAAILADCKLTPLQQRAVFRRLGFERIPTADCELSDRVCRGFWVAAQTHDVYLDPEQRALLLDQILADPFDTPLEQSGPLLLVIADGRYVTWTGRQGILDLWSGDWVCAETVDDTRFRFLKTVAYNLSELFARCEAKCLLSEERRDARNTTGAAGNPGGPEVA